MVETKIPILDLTGEIESLWGSLTEAVHRVLRSGQFVLGEEVAAFEREAAAYLGVRHAVGCNSGTDALVLCLRSLGVGPGDEVICPSFSFVATAGAVSIIGATPVFADIDEATFNMDVEDMERHITPRTKAVIPVDLFGQAADMGAVCDAAMKHELKVVEDVAQAFGGSYKGKKLGGFGDIAAYSFFPTKNLGAYGDGGMVATNDDKLAELVRMLRVHGSKKRYHNELDGYNSRLDALQAAILRVKLPHVDEWNAARRGAADRYDELLGGQQHVITPFRAEYAGHVFHQYTVRITNGRRDEVVAGVNEQGVGAMVYYPVPIHRLPVYQHLAAPALPRTQRMCEQVLSLPMWPGIDAATQRRVAEVLLAAV